MVRNPRLDINPARSHAIHDLPEVFARRVAAAQHRQFTLMKIGVVERHVAIEHSDQHELATVFHIIKTCLHGLLVTRAIKHRRGQAAIQKLLKLWQWIAFGDYAMVDFHCVSTELQPLSTGIHGNDAIYMPDGLNNRQTDGADADDQNSLPGLQGSPPYGMCSNAECLDQGQLIQRKPLRLVQLRNGDSKGSQHPAIDVHAKEPEIPTAVSFPSPAGAAITAIEIGLQGALITR